MPNRVIAVIEVVFGVWGVIVGLFKLKDIFGRVKRFRR